VRFVPEGESLVVASAGNFGQGIAYAARKRGIGVTVFAPATVNELKLRRMRSLGAEVVLAGDDFDAAKVAARDYAANRDCLFVEDGRDAAISEGAGSIAVELLASGEHFDAVVVSVGNGALINGIGTWVKARSPGTRVVGVCAAGAPAMERSWSTGEIRTTAAVDTIADGIAVRVPVAEAVDEMRDVVDEFVLVDDASIIRSMHLLLRHTGLLIEPSGAAGVAAIVTHREMFARRRVATILCGGNVTPEQMRAYGAFA
jgi:threonine dehydratase